MEETLPLVNSAASADLIVIERTEWELCRAEQVPSYLRSPDIAGWYRVHFSLKLCLMSLLRLHNELLNIHTHLLGSMAFVAAYAVLYTQVLRQMQSWIHFAIISLYVLAVAWLLLCSSAFHCFNCRSPDSYACMARLDYSGIGIVILTSQWGAMSYAFVCWPEAFIGFAAVLGVFTILVVLGPMFPAFHHRKYRIPRALMLVSRAF
jgi:adiponectin receptor